MTLSLLLIVLILLGLGLVTILFFQPRFILSLTNFFVPGVIYFQETQKPLIALTIDDGPDPLTTAKILDILEHYEARATFFLISNSFLKIYLDCLIRRVEARCFFQIFNSL
jgi:peptidoglycan/xylan/chitin deacetylase (PgdA/CDA1 family)